MLSNLASYIFGAAVESVEPELEAEVHAVAKPVEGVNEEEWVLVEDRVPALNLGSLNDVFTRASLGSTCSSSLDTEDSGVPMEDGVAEGQAQEPVALTRTARRLTIPFGSLPQVTSLSDIQCVRASQSLRVKNSGKGLTSKALERRNKAVKQQGFGSCKSKAPTMSLRASGARRCLKQC